METSSGMTARFRAGQCRAARPAPSPRGPRLSRASAGWGYRPVTTGGRTPTPVPAVVSISVTIAGVDLVPRFRIGNRV
jgi:hypothetical protein